LSLNGGRLFLWSKWLGISVMCATMASCATTNDTPKTAKARSKEYFSEKEYGVKASPRVVADGKPVPKGGGRFMVGQPYEVKGKTYVPKEDPNYNKSGLASWYGSAFHGRLTANGEVYDSSHLSAAHPTFPLPSYARVTNTETGTSVIVRVNDRGPYHPGRIIDVSDKTAELLDMKRTGTAKVNVQYVGRARMDGKDMPFLMASYIRKGDRVPSFNPGGQIATGVMVASNQPLGEQLQSYGSSLPQAVPVPGERWGAPAARPAKQRNVAAAYPSAPAEPRVQAAKVQPAKQRVEVATIQPVQARPVQPQRAQPAKQQFQAQPVQAQTTQTAYAAEPSAPRVMFGNMLLEPPKPGQKY
jgi:rare lipoprotein A